MITREDMVEQSVMEWVRAQLLTRGYPPTQVEIVESFPFTVTELEKNTVALGFNFDDQGRAAEMGSDFRRRVYTLEFLVFGKTLTYARNLANAVKFALDVEGAIPLLDIEQAGAPEIDRMIVLGVRSQRQEKADPEPWEEFTWATTVTVEDIYSASLA